MIRNQHRHGVMLIVVVGFAAILLAVSWSFFARMRSDAQESESVVQEIQARMMFYAATNYIQETARMGWHNPSGDYATDGIMDETYGWVDLRDGSAGPKTRDGTTVWGSDSTRFPAPGTSARFPMYVMERTPFAISSKRVHNPLPTTTSFLGSAAYDEVVYDMPNLPLEPVASEWADFVAGDKSPRSESTGRAWFRIYRESSDDHDGQADPGDPVYDVPGLDLSDHHGIFVVTCGSGGTMGFRDWEEASTVPGGPPFDEVTFYNLRAQERILWYRLEWSPSVIPGTYGNVIDAPGSATGAEMEAWDSRGGLGPASGNQLTLVRTPPTIARNAPLEGGSIAPNPVGTIQWIMRLEQEPPNW